MQRFWVNSGQPVSGQNPAMSAIARKRTFIGSFVPLSERWMAKAAFASF
jgi:hypothetical protein